MSNSNSDNTSMGDSPTKNGEGSHITTIIKKNIHKALHSIQAEGDFATFGSFQHGLNPGLEVIGIGPIELPLSPQDAAAIIDVCHRSPFGKGTETVVDTSVRKCWELDATQIWFRNTAWKKQVNDIVSRAITGLGILKKGCDVRAEPYKVLLYEEGAFFLPHQDSPKADKMFATLVISLSSEHEGGEVVVTHDGKSHTFESSKTSAFGTSYAAWYADVVHEIKPVTSGHRLVLTYNLIHMGADSVPSACKPDSKLLTAMELWKSELETSSNESPQLLLYNLSHKYTEASLGFHAMKGKDQQHVLQLQDVCHQLGFLLYLGNVQREVEGGCEEMYSKYHRRPLNADGFHDIIEPYGDKSRLTKIVGADGKDISLDISVEPKEFVQTGVLDGTPDDEDYSGFTGNEGTSTTHFYRRTVAIILPKSKRIDFHFRGTNPLSGDMEHWLGWLLTAIKDPDDHASLKAFKHLSKLILAHNRMVNTRRFGLYLFDRYSDDVLSDIAKGHFEIGDFGTFKTAVMSHSKDISPVIFEYTTKILATSNPPVVIDMLDGIYEKTSSNILTRVKRVHGLVSPCLAIHGDNRPPGWDNLKAWELNKIKATLFSAKRFRSLEDALPLVYIAEKYPEEAIVTRITEIVKGNIQYQRFVIAFLGQLYDSFKGGRLQITEVPIIYEDIFSMLMSRLSLKPPSPAPPPRPAPLYPSRASAVYPRKQEMAMAWNSDILINLSIECESLKISVDKLLRPLVLSFSTVPKPGNIFNETLLSFLQDLVRRLTEADETKSEVDEKYTAFIREILFLYIKLHVGPKPDQLDYPSSNLPSCSCEDCKRLSKFLTDRFAATEEFSMLQRRRTHLQNFVSRDPALIHETWKFGTPHTLVVTKENHLYINWNKRATDAANAIKKIGSSHAMEAILGVDFYRSLLSLDIVKIKKSRDAFRKIHNGPTRRKRAATSEIPPGNHTVDRKKPAQVIDLTK